MMTFREIRETFFDYFTSRGHKQVTSSSLVPRDDPSLLFTNAGMVQFKGLYLGEEKRSYSRAVTSQKCVRAGGKHNDLENVGYTARHHTFFEMLGNFSFGDYFKEETISWAWELLTEGFRLPAEKLHVSVYKDDDEAYKIWEEQIGVPTDRIVRLGDKDNFWTMGDTGPCGPCSEIMIDQGPSLGCGKPDCAPGCDCDRYLEIWNLVFTQFDRSPEGVLTPLPKPNIDTGMGLERIAAVVQGVFSNYDTDLFSPIIGRITDICGSGYGADARQDVSFRVISDHARAAAFLIGDGIMPSNEGRGYVLRRIIRRAIRFGQILGMKEPFLHKICLKVIEIMGPDYGELIQAKSLIEGVVHNEERRFADTLHYGLKVLNDEIEALKARGLTAISGDLAFKLYDTYGLSIDIVQDVAREEHLAVDSSGYGSAMSRRRALSQESWKGSGEEQIPESYKGLLTRGLTCAFLGYESLTSRARVVACIVDGRESDEAKAGTEAGIVLEQTPFYGEAGGQVGDTGWIVSATGRFRVKRARKFSQDLIVHEGVLETGSLRKGQEVDALVDKEKRQATVRNHSATHLLHAALREILGDHVKQAGSLVSPERLRFDFSHFTQVVPEKLRDIESLVNRHIRENLEVSTRVMTKENAMETGAMAIFEERYGEEVRVVSMGEGISRELCGGTHTGRTGDIGLFRIVSEGGVAANVRRIEALTGQAALRHDQEQERVLRSSALLLKTTPNQVAQRLERLLEELKEKEKQIEVFKARLLTQKSGDILSGVKEMGGVKVLAKELEADSPRDLRDSADRIKDKLGSGIIALGATTGEKVMLTCVVTKDLVGRFHAGDIIREMSAIVGGKGGGRRDMAQGGGTLPQELGKAFQALYALVEKHAGQGPLRVE
jgi:alanyl-tRNA synthetase